MKHIHLAVSAAALVGIVVTAQSPPTRTAGDGDWASYSRDLAGARFSPLTDITPANVAQLAQAWSVQLTPPAGRRGGGPPPADAAAPGRGAAPVGRAGAAGRGAGAAGPAAQGRGGAAAAVDPSGVAQLGSNPQ